MKDNNIIQEAINTLKRLHKENKELKAAMEDKDEYIASLLLSLFLMQGEIDRLNETLDLARKGELVFIKNPQIEELKAENARLKEDNGKLFDKAIETRKENVVLQDTLFTYRQTLQKIKEIADARCNECKYGKDGISCKYGDCGEAKLHLITQLITKAEEE